MFLLGKSAIFFNGHSQEQTVGLPEGISNGNHWLVSDSSEENPRQTMCWLELNHVLKIYVEREVFVH